MLNDLFINQQKLIDLKNKYNRYKQESKHIPFSVYNECVGDELYQLCIQSIHFQNLDELLEYAKQNNKKVAEFVFSTALKMKELLKNGI